MSVFRKMTKSSIRSQVGLPVPVSSSRRILPHYDMRLLEHGPARMATGAWKCSQIASIAGLLSVTFFGLKLSAYTEPRENNDCPGYTIAIENREIPLERSLKGERVNKGKRRVQEGDREEDIVLFAGNSNAKLANEICEHLGSPLGKLKLSRFADGEVNVQILESIRGKDVYILQSTSPPVNENLMELLLLVSTCRRASAKKITVIIPYYGYARQDRKMSSRVPISAADVARLLETVGVDRVVSIDLHCGQIQGFFGPRVPVDNLEAQMIGLEYFLGRTKCSQGLCLTGAPLKNPIIVSPDAGGVYRARKFQEGMINLGCNAGIAMIIKQRSEANKIVTMDLVGNVKDCDCIIVDDMIDTAGTLCKAAQSLKEKGANRVYAFATHGLFSGTALDLIHASSLEEVIITDSIIMESSEMRRCPKVHQLTVSFLIADAIRRIHQKESLNVLFDVNPNEAR